LFEWYRINTPLPPKGLNERGRFPHLRTQPLHIVEPLNAADLLTCGALTLLPLLVKEMADKLMGLACGEGNASLFFGVLFPYVCPEPVLV
jgi:hypothetical protein